MSSNQITTHDSAVILGGGGITAIGWEIGILSGLLESGVELHKANTVFGTSAGAFVGVALSSGYDMEQLFKAQLERNDTEIPATANKEIMNAWYEAFKIGGNDRQKVGTAFGNIAKANPEPVPVSQRQMVVQNRLVTTTWPQTLKVTTIEAETGQLNVLDHTSGISLVDAVSASGAVPGIWPIVEWNGRKWIDGGMVSSTNVLLSAGYKTVLVLAPMPQGYGLIPGVVEDIETMKPQTDVFLIVPDAESKAAIGINPYDPTHKSAAAIAGRNQGRKVAAAVKAKWI
ncbi:patatin-like phospholipase family protein [uncultured Mucilaginibacter sp.]|uniref:patatin-like phospholipase family protein n=1 Tax=uncultured Mucilaginibacter sp. TaxID=797541 RepID=UPI0026192081|nr:patatin-like phospholipase family protein [uncultured Mucilaginibacter sp.]